jgi:hypothetical protein
VNTTAAVAAGELEKILKVFNLIKNADTKLIKVRTRVCVCMLCITSVCMLCRSLVK